MRARTISGYVLKKTRYKETSQIIELFSRERGRISFMLKGALREKSRYLGLSEYLNLLEVNYLEREDSSLFVPRSMDLLEENSGIVRSEKYFMMSGEMVRHLRQYIPWGVEDEDLYEALGYMVKGIDIGKGNKALIYFFLKLLRSMGKEISSSMPCGCGSGQPQELFSMEMGRFHCRSCGGGIYTGEKMCRDLSLLSNGRGRETEIKDGELNTYMEILRNYLKRNG